MITEYRQQQLEVSVRPRCQRLGVSRSWLYEKSIEKSIEKPVACEPTEENTALRDAIEKLCGC